MPSFQNITAVPKVLPTLVKLPKKRPIVNRSPSIIRTVNEPIQVFHQSDSPTIWVTKGDLAEVSKRVKENISGTWKVKPISNTPRPESLVSKDDVSTWIQPVIHPDDTLEGVIKR